MEKKKKSGKKTVYTVIGMIALVVALVCVTILAVKQYRMWKAERLYDQMADATTLPASSDVTKSGETESLAAEEDTAEEPEVYTG